ncbi:hypothetical protein [Nocardia sp. N2S4-5]
MWFLVLTFAIATGALVVSSGVLLLLMAVVNAVTAERPRPAHARTGTRRP